MYLKRRHGAKTLTDKNMYLFIQETHGVSQKVRFELKITEEILPLKIIKNANSKNQTTTMYH